MASRETFCDPESNASEEDGNRVALAEGAAKEKTSPAVRRHHPFSVEALMSGRTTDGRGGGGGGGGRGGEPTCRIKPEGGAATAPPAGLNPVYLCRETCSPPLGSRKSSPAAPSSPVKSEASEPEDCAHWATDGAFSTQARKHLPHYET